MPMGGLSSGRFLRSRFGRGAPQCTSLLRLLGGVLQDRAARGVAAARERFRRYFETCGLGLIDEDRPAYSELLASQTYYHLFLSLYATRIVDHLTGRLDSARLLDRLASGRGALGDIVGAQVFRDAGFENLLEPELYLWVAGVDSEALERAVGALASALRELPPAPAEGGDADPLRELYLSLSPRAARRALGEFYTPDWLVELVLDRVGWPGAEPERLLDPTCGSGSFLVHAIQRLRRQAPARDPGEAARDVLRRVEGIDLNPLAVSTSRVNYLMALGGDLVRGLDAVRLPVRLGDALFGPRGVGSSRRTGWQGVQPAELLVGNPPWINWEQLSPAYRDAILTHPRGYARALFPHRGLAARGGGAHDDVAALLTMASADTFLADGGRLGFVLPVSVFKSKGGGAGFRCFELPGAFRLGVERVDDLVGLRPFPGASGKAAVLTASRGRPTVYPVRYLRWTAQRPPLSSASLREVHAACSTALEEAVPVDGADATSPWLTASPGELEALQSVAGASGYRARKGVDTSLNAVFWVRVLDRRESLVRVRNAQTRSRTAVPPREALVDRDTVYPLLRGRDFRRWNHRVTYHLLLLYDPRTGRPRSPEEATRQSPRTFDYFQGDGYPELLRRRRIYAKHLRKQPPYACYDIGPYTFSEHKVVWKALATGIQAAVVGRDEGRVIVPDHNVLLVPLDDPAEAHYLCAVLNSRLCTAFARAYTEWFYSAHLLRYFRIPKYNARLSCHRELSRLSRDAHSARAGNHPTFERSIDEQVGRLKGFESARPARVGGSNGSKTKS
ncbi:MAG: N-6 DNA methylase [bacterium]